MKVQVLEAKQRSGVAKSGKPYSFQICKAVISSVAGIEVGEIVLFDEQQPVLPGDYMPEFEIKRDQSGRLQGHIAKLVPVRKS